MRLKSLTTTHFKKLGSQTFLFGPGLNVIAGDNAQGKSTLLQAIEAALFGASVIPGKSENIPTWGQKKWALELHFELGNAQYMVTRNSSTAKLSRVEGEELALVANGTTAVKTHVEELLALASKDYNLFIQSRQGESTGILTFGAAALNRKVEEFAGVDLIEKVQQAAQLRATRLSAGAEAKSVPEEMLNDAQRDLDQADDEVIQRQAAHVAAQKALEDFGEFNLPEVKDNAAAMREEAHAADLLWAKVEAAEKSVAPAEAAVKEAEQRLAGRQRVSAEALNEQLNAVQKEGVDAKAELDKLRQAKSAFDQANQALNAAREAKAQADANVLQLPIPEEVSAAENSLDDAENALTAASEELQEAKLKHQGLAKLAEGAQCPTCGHVKEDHDPDQLAQEMLLASEAVDAKTKVVQQAKNALGEAKAKVSAYQDHDRKAQASLDAATLAEGRFNTELAKWNTLTKVDDSQLHDAETTYQGLRDKFSQVQADLRGVEAENTRFDQDTQALKRAQEGLLTAKQNAQDLAQQFEDLPEPPTEEEILKVEEAVKAYAKAQADWKFAHGNLTMALKEAAADVRIAVQARDTALATCHRLQEQNKTAADDVALAKRYDRLVRFLREGRQGYMQQVWTTIMAVSSRLVNESSRGLITKIVNDDGEFLFEEAGVLAPSSSASGAQKAFIGTALRVGLSRTLYGGDSLLIFDEPTESCSEHNASAMAATLATSAKQVLLITHRETDQALASRIINVGA